MLEMLEALRAFVQKREWLEGWMDGWLEKTSWSFASGEHALWDLVPVNGRSTGPTAMVQLSVNRWAIKTRKSNSHVKYGSVWTILAI